MLTKVVEKQSPESMETHVAEVMPGLLKVSFLTTLNIHLYQITTRTRVQ